MSKKYVPTFLKGASQEPVVNTSKPAVEAPKLAPATLASLTKGSNGGVSAGGAAGGGNRSFADKFAEQAKQAEDPKYIKPLNLASADDFPSLGAPKKVTAPATTAAPFTKVWSAGGAVNSFADKVKTWAKEAGEAEAKAKKNAKREARKEAEKERMRRMVPLIRRVQRNPGDDSDEDIKERPYDESSLGDSDDYDSFDDDAPPSDDEEENEEQYNGEIGYDGRRRGDIY
jgi:hypothetical protein